MAAFETVAQAVSAGDAGLVAGLAARPLKPLRNNFVERPWGGLRLRELKGLWPLPDQIRSTGLGLGETFEISACDEDEEARAHPSRIRFEDGSELTLSALLERHAAALLGPDFTALYGASFPLLPKLLDVKELLSVQGHPEGHTEVYVIIDAEPGASIRVGFNRDLEAGRLAADLRRGLDLQRRVLDALEPGVDLQRVQNALEAWLADRASGTGAAPAAFEGLCRGGRSGAELAAVLGELKALYWYVLDAMNVLDVAAGDVVYNANPERVAARRGRARSAEVHALGNPERREILALEIRRPGPTFRAWDNVRFPPRRVDLGAALEALNLERTEAEEFRVATVPAAGRDGVFRSVRTPEFELEHLRPAPGGSVAVPAEPPHCLHALGGRVEIRSARGGGLGFLEAGESAVVPIGVGAYRVVAEAGPVEIVKVGLPRLRAAGRGGSEAEGR